MSKPGHNSKVQAGPVNAERLKSFVERIAAVYERQIKNASEIDAATGCITREMRLPEVNTYVLRGAGTDLVKIGKSQNVSGRLRSLQSGSPAQLEVIRAIPFDCERRMHVRFAHLRKHGEWFQFDIDMLAETFHEDIFGMARAHLEAA